MHTLKVKKLHPDAKLPTKAHATDAGWDLYLPTDTTLNPCSVTPVPLGIAVEIPLGFYGHMKPRSSAFMKNLNVSGVIDCDYRGELTLMVYNPSGLGLTYPAGSRIAQMLLLPVSEFEVVEVEELSETPRGSGAFGSSGR